MNEGRTSEVPGYGYVCHTALVRAGPGGRNRSQPWPRPFSVGTFCLPLISPREVRKATLTLFPCRVKRAVAPGVRTTRKRGHGRRNKNGWGSAGSRPQARARHRRRFDRLESNPVRKEARRGARGSNRPRRSVLENAVKKGVSR
jgi:hypothetical protein